MQRSSPFLWRFWISRCSISILTNSLRPLLSRFFCSSSSPWPLASRGLSPRPRWAAVDTSYFRDFLSFSHYHPPFSKVHRPGGHHGHLLERQRQHAGGRQAGYEYLQKNTEKEKTYFLHRPFFFLPLEAFHDCVGGCDGCVNLDNASNDGLADVIAELVRVSYCPR